MSETKNCQAPCVDCDIEPFTRNYYFTGKLLVERDFKQEQEYYVDKMRHHDQTLHGWGVVCGLKVQAHQNPQCRNRFVCIEPGTAIDCCGHEILVHDEDCIDITQLAAIKALAAKKDTDTHTLQICLRYRECPTEQIPVLYDDCGCNEIQCAPNRVLESYDVDVIVDPTDKPASPTSPTLQWSSTINVAHSQDVALNEGTRRLYVLTSDNPAAIYEVSTDNFSIVASHTLTAAEGQADALAISDDGALLYVVLVNGNLLVLNTADFSEAATTAIPGAAGGATVDLAFTSDGHLLTLAESAGTIEIWPSPITNGVVPTTTINLTTPSRGLVLGSSGTSTYSVGDIVGTSNQNVEVATLATSAVASTSVLPADTVPSGIALVSSASGDQLAVVDQKSRLFLVAMTSPPTLVGTAALSNPAISVVASPDGLWAYVLEGDAAGNNFVEPIDLGSLRAGLPLAATTPLPVGPGSQQLVLSQSGATLYVPYTGGAAALPGGGVAILTVSEKACCDLFWKSLDGCPSCATADCIVLATINNYKVGFYIQDQTDPPADATKDLTQQYARIDNYTRHLLPSTSTIAEVVKCLCESKGGKGAKGDPGANGAPGKDGAPGLGLNPDLPKIIDIGWVHQGESITWNDFVRSLGSYNTSAALTGQGTVANNVLTQTSGASFGNGMVGATVTLTSSTSNTNVTITNFIDTQNVQISASFPAAPFPVSFSISELLPQIRKQIDAQNIPLLIIYFNQPVLNGIDRQTFRVSIEYPFFTTAPVLTEVSTVFAGVYNPMALNLYGYPISLGPMTTPHTGEAAPSAWAFIPDRNFFTITMTSQAVTAMFQGMSQQPPLDAPCVHVTLKGDFIYAGVAFDDKMMLDADNIGGQVGMNVTRAKPPNGGQNPSGDLVEGGDFESWFFLLPPANADNKDNLINPNSAPANSLANLPGISATIAKKIVAEREVNGNFSSVNDLGKRLKLSDKIVNSLRDHVTFD